MSVESVDVLSTTLANTSAQPNSVVKTDASATARVTCTTCPYCGVGCGVSVSSQPMPHAVLGEAIQVTGDLLHPANAGRLCVKGSNLHETLSLERRVLAPQMGRIGNRQATDWEVATRNIAQTFADTIRDYGPDSVAFYVSGQLLTEDYYVVNKFVKGYLGTANIDTNSRLCMSSAVAAHKRAFGEDVVPGCYEDFEQAEVVVLVGSNTAWCHPVLYQRVMQARQQSHLKVVVIDPRHTLTAEDADLHLPILPGQDIHLFNGLLQWLVHHGHTDEAFVDRHTEGLDDALLASAECTDLYHVARLCGLDVERLRQFYQLFADTRNVVTLFSMGVNQSRQGSDKANAIINCHLLTGRIGQPGMGPFSMTGQPNAMGGREVGGLSNMLAAHMDLDNPVHRERVQAFWKSPVLPTKAGLKAVELFEAIEQGRVRAVWIMATNPVVSLPNADQVKRALRACPFVVVSDVMAETDTTAFADVLLPALGWGEKNGTVTNSERRISRQRAFLPAPAAAKPDWWAISQVAAQMGFGDAFAYQHPADIFQEHARLSACDNPDLPDNSDAAQPGQFRRFNLKGLSALTRQDYDRLQPIQWPVLQPPKAGTAVEGTPRLFADGWFSHPNGRARFIPVAWKAPVRQPCDDFPLILNTGRVRDHWHTMTRTGLAPALTDHTPEPFCQLHPQDALMAGVRDGGLVRVSSRWGACVVRAQTSTRVRRGQVFVPIHWNDGFASDARIGALVNPVVDPVSGEPEFKYTPVRVSPFATNWQAMLFSRQDLSPECLNPLSWWTRLPMAGVQCYSAEGRSSVASLMEQARVLLGFVPDLHEWMEYHDQSSGVYHALLLKDNQVMASLYLAPPSLLPDRQWVAGRFARARLSSMDRLALLAGASLGQGSNEGPLVCSCFKVGKNRILTTIREQGLTTAGQVTACLKAGGNCGSCLPEIRGLIATCQLEATAE